VTCALLMAIAIMPLYSGVHESIESLVAFGTSYVGWFQNRSSSSILALHLP
jgi:hypothetical protein